MSISLDGQVAIITGAGNGLGRAHALQLAQLGAKVVVNDLGTAKDGSGSSLNAANEVVKNIQQQGGEAFSHGANVADYEQVQAMVNETLTRWGRIDILVNNAGILRDKTFSKMTLDDFRLVMDVHVMGSVHCTKAVWEQMKAQQYGRIVMTTSGSGLYGNYGQSNYSAAKMALIGLMNTLVLEGHKYNIKVNALAPTAGTRMTEGLLPKEIYELLTPKSVSLGLASLCHKDAPNRKILCAGAGVFASTHIQENQGKYFPPEDLSVDKVFAEHTDIFAKQALSDLQQAGDQTIKFAKQAMTHHGIPWPDAKE